MNERQVKWDVYIKDEKLSWFDAVFFNPDMTKEDVEKSLIDHDGYPSHIFVIKG